MKRINWPKKRGWNHCYHFTIHSIYANETFLQKKYGTAQKCWHIHIDLFNEHWTMCSFQQQMPANSLHILTNGTFICALDKMSLRFGNANAKASITKAINQNKSPPVIALSIFGWQKNDPSMTIRLFHSQVFHSNFFFPLSLSLCRIWLWFSFIFRCIHLTWIIIIKEKFILNLERTTNIFNWLQSHLQSQIWFTSWTMEIIKKDLIIGFDDQK